MTPTNELRFVEREVAVPWQSNPEISEVRKVHILQQKWQEKYWIFDEVGNKSQPEEWRDIPLEKEAT